MAKTAYSMVVAIFQDVNQAQQAIDALTHAGFDRDQINFAGHGNPQGPFAGLKRLFTGEGASATGAYDDLVGRGMPEEEARYYQQEYENGRSIVSVTGVDRMQEAATLLSSYGGYGASRGSANYGEQAIDSTRRSANYGEQAIDSTRRSANYGEQAIDSVGRSRNYGDTTNSVRRSELTDTQGEQRMQLKEERLNIFKTVLQAGEVGLRKEVVSEQKSIDVPITREEVVIQRRPGSGQPSDRPIGEQETFKVPVREEQVNVKKETVVREEVGLGKRQVQDTRHVTDTVRREEARVEREGNVNIVGDTNLEREEGRLGERTRRHRDERDINIASQDTGLDRP